MPNITLFAFVTGFQPYQITVSDRVYPYIDNIGFIRQYLNEIFILTDGSMWAITGISDNENTGSGAKNLTIYSSSTSTPDPRYGDRSDYFMLIEENSTTYFVKELPYPTVVTTDNIVFSRQYLNEIFDIFRSIHFIG